MTFVLPGDSSSFSGSRNGLAGLPVGGATALRLPLVPGLFPLRQRDLTFYLPVLEIHSRGNQRVSALLGLAQKLTQLFSVHQKLARAQRSVMRITRVLIGADVCVQQPELAVFHERVGILEVGATGANRFHLGSGQDHPSFEAIFEEVVVTGRAVDRGVAFSGSNRIPLDVLGLVRFSLMDTVAGHGTSFKCSGSFCSTLISRRRGKMLPYVILSPPRGRRITSMRRGLILISTSVL